MLYKFEISGETTRKRAGNVVQLFQILNEYKTNFVRSDNQLQTEIGNSDNARGIAKQKETPIPVWRWGF